MIVPAAPVVAPIVIALSAVASVTTTFFPPSTLISPEAPETFTSVVVAAFKYALVAFLTFSVSAPVKVVVSKSAVFLPISLPLSKLIVSIFLIVAETARIFSSDFTFNVSLPSPPSKESTPVKVFLAPDNKTSTS